MNEPMQIKDTGHYERPNQPYECGHSCEGVSCLLGPTPTGGCQAGPECQPIEKGGAWICGRTQIQGGKCDNGPTADGVCCLQIPRCSPKSSLRVRRGMWVFFSFAATFGAVLFVLGSPWRNELITPGELTQSHGQILKERTDLDSCQVCHPAGNASAMAWAASLISYNAISQHGTQSGLCMECHGDMLVAETALLPHGIPATELKQRTDKQLTRLDQAAPRPVRVLQDGKLACSACHREHHGADFQLTAVSNTQCATCHQDEFSSLADHPSFGNWPYSRRTRIAFDHVSHSARHFSAEGQEFACRSCHIDTQSGEVVSVVSFEQSCAGCHEQKIEQSLGDGIALLVLPMLDVRTLARNGFSVGEWPPAAQGDFDGALPPLTRALLNADPFARSALAQFGEQFDFLDVDPSSIDDLEAASDIAWGIKTLIYELVQKGPTAMAGRLEVAFGHPVTEQQLAEFMGQLSHETIRDVQKAWFPNLTQEMPAHLAGRPLPKPTKRSQRDVLPASMKSGWLRDDEVFGFYYRPLGHGSNFIKVWIEATACSPKARLSDDIMAVMQEFASSRSKGLCTTCHSIDNSPTEFGAKVIHWKGKQIDPNRQKFTKFRHDPHVILPGLSDCVTCHQLAENSRSYAHYQQSDPTNFESSFVPIEKEACAKCHAPHIAGDTCLECHHYHVNDWRME